MFSNFEINGNLFDHSDGVKNYDHFMKTVMQVRANFISHFGPELMSAIPLLIDNGTHNTGYAPIITLVWGSGLIIKLNITDGIDKARIIYQSAHEFTHYIFYSLAGL